MLIATAVGALSWILDPAPPAEPSRTYRLRITSVEPLQVGVQASLPPSQTLSTSDYGAWSQPRGWSTFVRELEARTADGSSLAVIEDGAGWSLEVRDSEDVHLSYTVDLSHMGWPTWPDGPRTTSGYDGPDGAFVLLGALLVHAEGDGPGEIVFEGEEWGRVAAPFESTGPRTFRMESVRSGVENAIAFWVDELTETSVGDLRVQIVNLGGASETSLFAALARDALDEFAGIFRASPSGELLAIVYPDAWDTGEAYTDSFVLSTTRQLTDGCIAVWGQSVAHELFHRWLGQEIRGVSWADSNWFMEGATDYVASLFLVRSGYVGVDVFLDQLEKRAAFHRLYHKGPPFAGLDLVSAGADKGPNNAAIYDGGWLTALAIDVRLQQETDGRMSIEDFLHDLRSFCREVDGGYRIEDLEQLLSEASGTEFGPFFDRHVRGAEPLASGVRSKAASRGRVKTGQLGDPGRVLV